MNEEQLLKLIKDTQWHVDYHSVKLTESASLLELYSETLKNLTSNE